LSGCACGFNSCLPSNLIKEGKMKHGLKIYMGYSYFDSPESGAAIIFAHTAKEAKQFSFALNQDWGDGEWTDSAVRLLSGCDHLYEQADQKMLADGIAHMVDHPVVCSVCELWGLPIDPKTRICVNCSEE